MVHTIRVDLVVPYVEKDDAKALGARWDVDRKVWYAPPGTDLSPLRRWLPEGVERPVPIEPGETTESEPQKGMALIHLLARVRGVLDKALPEAVWVRAEISQLGGKKGNLFLTLAQRNERGDIVAEAKGLIWKSQAEPIAAKFERATGEGLRTDIKILCLARVRIDMLHGLELVIEDVDPSYTLGDLAAKLARIRERLQRERAYGRNKSLPAPVEYVRFTRAFEMPTWQGSQRRRQSVQRVAFAIRPGRACMGLPHTGQGRIASGLRGIVAWLGLIILLIGYVDRQAGEPPGYAVEGTAPAGEVRAVQARHG